MLPNSLKSYWSTFLKIKSKRHMHVHAFIYFWSLMHLFTWSLFQLQRGHLHYHAQTCHPSKGCIDPSFTGQQISIFHFSFACCPYVCQICCSVIVICYEYLSLLNIPSRVYHNPHPLWCTWRSTLGSTPFFAAATIMKIDREGVSFIRLY